MAQVRKILEDYDVKMMDCYEKFAEVNRVDFDYSNSDLELNTVTLFDKNNKLINKYKYSIIGLYERKEKIWIWSWAIPYLRQNEIILSRQLLNYGLDLKYDDNIDDDKAFMYDFLKPELVTSRFKVNDQVQLDIHLAIASYITKHDLLFEYKFPNTTSSYYIFLEPQPVE
jgi:hypothetical protein